MKFFKYSCLVLASFFIFSTSAMADRGRIYVSTDYLYDVCMSRCAQTDSLGNLTRNGCLKGCAEIRRTFPLKNKSYRSMSSCLQDMMDFELERDLFIEESKKWCSKEYTHLHKRKGCWDAMEVYINAATPNTICYGQKENASIRAVGDPGLIGTLPPSIDIPLVYSEPIRDTPAYGERAKRAPRLKAPTSQTATKKASLSSPPNSTVDSKKNQSPSPAKNDGVPVLTPSSSLPSKQKTVESPAAKSPAKSDEKDLPFPAVPENSASPAAPVFNNNSPKGSNNPQIEPDKITSSAAESPSSQREESTESKKEQARPSLDPKSSESETANTETTKGNTQNQLQEAKEIPNKESDNTVELPELPLFPKEESLKDQATPPSPQPKPGLLPTIPTGLGPERNLYQGQPINPLPDPTSSSGGN